MRVWAADRPAALARLGRALAELKVVGPRTNVPLFAALLADPDFARGDLDVGMLDRKLEAGELAPPEDDALPDLPLIAAAIAHSERARHTAPGQAGGAGAGHRERWRSAARVEALRGATWGLLR
jgi:acetyl/propionyl-CoA carboxylase alpha subunit